MQTPTSPTTPRPGGPLPLAESLLKTLQEEQDAVLRLGAHFDAHRASLRERRPDVLEEATLQANDLVATLARLRQARDRQMRLLGRVLRVGDPKAADAPTIPQLADALRPHEGGDDAAGRLLALRESLRTHAEAARASCGEMEFALTYAMDLGREMLQALQGVDTATAPTRVYTPKGPAAQSTPPRSFLNTLG